MSSDQRLLQDKSTAEMATKKSPTVDELLRMLSGSGGKRTTTSPPPIPPKPKAGIGGMSIEAAKRSLGLIPGFRLNNDSTYKPTSTKESISGGTECIGSEGGGDATDGSSKLSNKRHTTTKTMMNSTELKIDTQIKPDEMSDINVTHIATRLAPPRLRAPLGGHVVYNSNAAAQVSSNHIHGDDDIFHQPSMATSTGSGCKRTTRPIVTELLDEANNNSINTPQRPKNSTITVEILEESNGNAAPVDDIHGNRGNKTFTRIHQQQPKSQPEQVVATTDQIQYPESLVITQTEYDDGDRNGITVKNCGRRATKNTETLDGRTAMNDYDTDSIDDQPPRSSTPSSTQYQIDNNSSSGASTATNNNRSSQNTYLSHGTRGSASDNSEGDTLNISRDTDELTNTSTHNQSGCELVGIDDTPGSKDSSPKKANKSDLNQSTPYTVQLFNETLLSTASSPPDRLREPNDYKSTNQQTISIQEMESAENLRKIVGSLQDEIRSLNSKVTHLSSKVEDLEFQLDRQRSTTTINKSTSSIYTPSEQQHDEYLSPASTLLKGAQSRSVSTINKLTPNMKTVSRHNPSYGQMSAYSRNSMAALNSTQSGTSPSTITSSGSAQTMHKHSVTPNGRRTSANQQKQLRDNNMNSSSLRRLPIHASTNSIYAESNKSGSASISPTPLSGAPPNSGRHQTGSPASYMSLAHQQQLKRDLGSFQNASMLSLSSIGNSTLKNTSLAGSVSNLSQFGTINSQLTNWPSLSNFVQSTHQAKDILYDDEDQVIRMVLYNTLITMRVPSWFEGEYNLDQIVDAPEVKLKLNWVHGYRGRDCRSNVHYLPTGECVYFVASVIVLYNPEAKTQRHYLGHTESVKCLAIHPNRLIVASGQSAVPNRKDKRPIVRVWNSVNLATLRVIEFNEDFDRSICCLAFSKHDTGATLAVVDESSEHTITLLDWQREKNWRLAEVNSGHEPVLAIDFHPIDKYALVAVGKATVNFWDIRGFTMAKKAGLFDKYDKPKYVLCMTFNDQGETITGDSNGNVIIWPRGANKPRRIIRDVHPGGVFSVLAMRDGTYLTGGRDRRIIEWDEAFEPTGRQMELPEHCGGVRFITTAKGSQVLIGTLRNAILIGSLGAGEFSIIMQGHAEATTALAVHPNQPKYLTGGFDNQIFFIDVETHAVEWTKCVAMPVTAACFSPNGRLLIIGSTLGNWIAMDAITQEILFTTCDGAGTINCVKFSSDGDHFCMGSSDCHVYVYQTNAIGNTFLRLGTCVGHSAPIKEMDWSEDNNYIQSQSMNFELLFWRAQNCRPVDDDNIVHDLKWSTHNCTIGFHVLGIWSDSIDSALVNYCDRSNQSKYMVAATDTGYINIYRWPTYFNQCQSQKYNGNVDKFNFVKFLHNDSRLIAVGAKSCVTTEWIIDD